MEQNTGATTASRLHAIAPWLRRRPRAGPLRAPDAFLCVCVCARRARRPMATGTNWCLDGGPACAIQLAKWWPRMARPTGTRGALARIQFAHSGPKRSLELAGSSYKRRPGWSQIAHLRLDSSAHTSSALQPGAWSRSLCAACLPVRLLAIHQDYALIM